MTNFDLYQKLLSIPAILIALCIHEYAHGRMAYALGDPTAKYSGRLTLNPIRHLDPLGALMMLIVGFGWAKPVPVNPRYFKNAKRGMALTAFAGPCSNFLLSIIAALICAIIPQVYILLVNSGIVNETGLPVWQSLLDFFYLLHILNLSLGLFNLIPLPPLDGSRILGILLPHKLYNSIMEHEREIYFAVLAWLFFGPRIADFLLRSPSVSVLPALTVIIRLLSPTGFLGDAVSYLSSLIFRLLSFIPFLSF